MQFKSNDKKGQKKKLLTILAGLMLILMLAGTYAWQSYTDWVKNHMQSLGFDSGKVTIVEEFPPPVITGEGGTFKKKVDVINSTPVASFVRVSMEEQISKLADGATNSQAYAKLEDAGFPVIFDAKQYYVAGSDWKDKTSELRVDKKAAPKGLKLFVKGEGSKAESALVYETTVARKDFPANFDFGDAKFPIPVRPTEGMATADYAAYQKAELAKIADKTTPETNNSIAVAQKVSGLVTRITEDAIYNVETTHAGLDAAEKNLGFWGYGTKVDFNLKEADWAGENVFVKSGTPVTPAKSADFIDTKVNSRLSDKITINYSKEGIVAGKGSTFDFKTLAPTVKWFYNEEDGYFYYLSPLGSGNQTSASVIESITFAKDPTFNLVAYDLHVGSEAIPASRAMLTAASKGGNIEDKNKEAYNKNGKVTESNGLGFGLTKDNSANLLEHLSKQATIEDSETAK